MRHILLVSAVSLLACSSGAALAEAQEASVVEMGTTCASDLRLDRLRGGADVGPTLHIGFGLERLTSVNGTVVASTRFQVQDITQVTPAEAQALQRSLGSVLTLRDGQASFVALPSGNQSLGTVIQNSLPNQTIRNVVTLDMTTNSLNLLRAAHASEQLRNLSLPGH
jgi:hypothetical protein